MRKVLAWMVKGALVVAIASGALMPSKAFAKKYKGSYGSSGSSGSRLVTNASTMC